ncbi:hypothetical protein ACLQ3C_10635 [Gordonia sp. DT30]|uniref:hypothetical protein n=1 Tax=unclassified Gordonia (in: high G+C Gram-positive bacteria) TaxID=2657482 RepID=UPI003CEC66CF
MNLHPHRLVIASFLAVGVMAIGIGSPNVAADTPPNPAVPLTITITSDEQVNEQLLWYDAFGRPRHQFDVALPDHDAHSGRWTGSLTLTPQKATRQHDDRGVHRVVFISAGDVAGCTITAGATTVADDAAEGEHAMAVCTW